MRGTPGAYVLIVSLSESRSINAGVGRPRTLNPGLYLYVGSALGGLEQRIARHLSKKKRRHWHIDYLLDVGQVRQVWIAPSRHKIECAIASSLAGRFEVVAGFGSSDCRCRSHLFYSPAP